ncbi:MAG: LLM class flavin-dependent oxidoreductase [Gemmatimonadales bacterium]
MDGARHDVEGFVDRESNRTVDVFAACPSATGASPKSYLKRVRDVARWSERQRFRGALVRTDETLIDPWLVTQTAVQGTRTLVPLVVVQPTHMHPFPVARKVATLACLYGRRVFIHWVAGSLKDDVPHDERYARLVEFATIVRQLTDGTAVTAEGRYYDARGLELRQAVDAALRPEFVVSGSSTAGRAASQALGALSLTHALPPDEDQVPSLEIGPSAALRIGIIARRDGDEAWRVAHRRFSPAHRRAYGAIGWARHPDDLRLSGERAATGTTYWTEPFENYQTMCPYLVGSHEEVSSALARYVQRGYGTFVLDEPDSEADLENARIVFDNARRTILEAA